MQRPIELSNLPKYLLRAAEAIEDREGGPAWEADVCRMGAHEIELFQRIMLGEPIELNIEEGDRANG